MTSSTDSKTPEAGQPTINSVTFRPGWALLAILIVLGAGIVTTLQEPDPQPIEPRADKSFFEWLWYPVEKNPGLRLKRVPNGLRAVSFAKDRLRGLAVGSGGTILASGDGGVSWKGQDSGVTNTLVAVHLDSAGKRAWAVGYQGVIRTTDDGGEHWTSQSSGSTSQLNAVQFMEGGQQGWIAGYDGTILATSDGGRNWRLQETSDLAKQMPPNSAKQAQPAPPNATQRAPSGSLRPALLALHFNTDGKRGWAAGNDSIFTTINGGDTWDERKLPGGFSVASMKFASDGLTGWAVGDTGLLSTRDGGANWTRHDGPRSDATAAFITVALSSDAKRIWVGRGDSALFVSSNDGMTWSRCDTGVNGLIFTLHFDAQFLQGWAVSEGGTLLTSSDGGKNWTTRTSSKASTLSRVYFDPTGQRGWTVGGTGLILATIDGGNHWEAQQSGVDEWLSNVTFSADAKRGWIVGDRGRILSTSDGGRRWTARNSGTQVNLFGVAFLADGQRGWAAGNDGTLLSTSNGGLDWKASRLEGQNGLGEIHFDSAGVRGWIVATDGTLLATSNGGRTWQPAKIAFGGEELLDVKFSEGGKWGVVVGDAAAVFVTNDGGSSWIRKESGTHADLRAVHLGKDGRSGWIVGTGGVTLLTRDGGDTWLGTESKVGSLLTGLAIADDNKVGWAVGFPPSLLKTEDGGNSWQPIAWPLSNQRYPAPWFWLSLLPAALLLRLSVRIDPTSPARGVEAIAASDAPVSDFARDRLQFGPLARGVSRFLRNINTQPPLTLAISGDWGSGKSTLMGLVCTDLRRYGTRPVWFNAWHHQNEEQLLAALLNTIRDKGLPPIGSADGLAFRLRLLVIRSKKHFAITCLALLAGAAFVGYLLTHGTAEWTALLNGISNAVEALMGPERISNLGGQAGGPLPPVTSGVSPPGAKGGIVWTDALHLAPPFVTGATALFSLYRALKAFKVDPAVLLSSATEKFKLKDASAQTSFRTRFAEQFDEVTLALPYTMVIVIDDLDRCHPETVLTVMEAVNFLVSSGKCFVMFGMATPRVQAALSLTFAKLADEMAPAEDRLPANATVEDRREVERERRLAYARDYLEKLINLEVIVPNRADIPAYQLIDGGGATAANLLSRSIAQFAEFWPAWLASAVLLAGFLAGFAYTLPHDATQVAKIEKASNVSATPALTPEFKEFGVPGFGNTKHAILAESQLDVNRYVPQMQESEPVVVDRWVAVATLLVFLAAAGGLILYRLRTLSNVVKDLQSYRDSLRVWMPVIQRYRGTPRAIKRFGNRLRYLAMLQHDTKYDETGFDKLRLRLTALSGRLWVRRRALAVETSQPAATPERALTEQYLVALASLQEVYGTRWQTQLNAKNGGNELERTIQSAIESYRRDTPGGWPPDGRTIEEFEQLLKGIRSVEPT